MVIYSGGQTGVDRAAIDFALKNNIPCGGWCPKGRLAEDGKIPENYPLRETMTTSYSYRTELNVRDSNGTLVIYSGPLSNGSELTINKAKDMNKPLMLIDLDNTGEMLKKNFLGWIKKNHIIVLNIAGPRASSNPGIYLRTMKLLEEIMSNG